LIGRTRSTTPTTGSPSRPGISSTNSRLGRNALEFHIATNVILETGFTILQFVGLASLAHEAGDHLFENLVDKWFWRNWHLFSILTGISMDYLIADEHRTGSFKEFMEEWIVEFFRTSDEFGLKKPWCWDTFLDDSRSIII
jgi:toluene monooxygenase system protein A